MVRVWLKGVSRIWPGLAIFPGSGWLWLFLILVLVSCNSATEPYRLVPVVTFDVDVTPYAALQGEPELFLARHSNKLTLYDGSKRIVWQGEMVGNWKVLGSGPLDETGFQSLFFYVSREEGCFLGVLRHTDTLHGWVGYVTLESWRVTERRDIDLVRTEDLDGDGCFEVLVAVNQYYKVDRGVYVLDSKAGKIRWSYLCAPFVSSLEIGDIDSDGKSEVILGLYGINNQVVVSGRRDSTGGVVVLSGEGKELLYREIGGEWARALPRMVSLNDKKLLVVSEQNYLGSNADPDSLYVFDGADLSLRRIIKTGEHFLGMDVIDVDHDGREEVVTGNTDGVVRAFDAGLSELARSEMTGSVEVLRTVDLDGDGRKEVVCYAENGVLMVLNEKLERLASLEVLLPDPAERFREEYIKTVRQKKGSLLLIEKTAYELVPRSLPEGGPVKIWMWALAGLLAAGLLFGAGWILYRIGARSVSGLYERIAQMQAKYEDERKKQEAEIYRLKTVELEKLVEERTAEVVRSAKLATIGVLAAGIAHQVNNPLHAVLLSSGVLRRLFSSGQEPADEFRREGLELLDALEKEVQRTQKVVKGLLAFTRERKLDVRPTDVNAVVQHALDLALRHYRTENLDIGTAFERDLPPAYVDSESLEQVVVNVIGNAYDATCGKGGILIRTAGGPEGTIRISISNDGPPIPENLREKIFEPLFTTKSEGRGTGLGLSVAVLLLDRFGGRIFLKESTQERTTFTIEVPAVREGRK